MYVSTVLASLLKKFSTDLPTLKALVQIPVHIDLNALTDRQSKVSQVKEKLSCMALCHIFSWQSVKEAVELLVDIAIKAQDSELLTSCAISLQCLMSGEYPLQAAVVASIDVFLDSVRTEFKKALEALQKVPALSNLQEMA